MITLHLAKRNFCMRPIYKYIAEKVTIQYQTYSNIVLLFGSIQSLRAPL